MRKDERDPPPAEFFEQGLEMPNGSKFEINHGGVLQKAEEERASPPNCEFAETAFGWMTGGEDKWRAQFPNRVLDIA